MTDLGQEDLTPFFEQSLDLLAIADLEGHFLRVNPAFVELLGYPMEQILATPFLEFVHPDDVAATVHQVEKLATGRDIVHFRNRYRCRDGSYRSLLWMSRSSPDRDRIYASARDVTEIEAREAELVRITAEANAREAELNAFFELSPDIFTISDGHGHYFKVNPQFEEVLGWTPEEALTIRADNLIHPDDLASLPAARADSAAGRPLTNFRLRFRCKDGSYRVLQWASRSQPELGRAYSSGRDVTEAARQEASLARLARIFDTSPDVLVVATPDANMIRINQTARRLLGIGPAAPLPTSVLELFEPDAAEIVHGTIFPAALRSGSWTGELAMTDHSGRAIPMQLTVLTHPGPQGGIEFLSMRGHDVSVYKDAERVKDDFLSTVSHELRTPLTSIRGSMGLIEGGAMGKIPPKAMNMVRIANSNTDRLIRLINDVMDVEKMRAGKLEMRRTAVPLASVASTAITEVAALAAEFDVVLAKEYSRPSPIVLGDHDRLVQLVVNLLSNAAKFSPAGSTVTVKVGPVPGEDAAMISVTDQGPGIAPEKQQWIFQRFTQVDSSSTKRRPGTGLGLAIAHEIAELHDGTLDVDSEPGHGATFTFTVPTTDQHKMIDGPAAPPSVISTPGSRLQLHGPKLLVVEDDEQLSAVYEALLTGAGYHVTTARSLAGARLSLEQDVPDALLLDIRLPDGNGLDLLSELAADDRFSSMTVIVISGSVDRPGGSLPLVVDWIPKPTDNLQLLSRLALDLAGIGQPHVLIVEDDEDTALVISELVTEIGCVPATSPDGRLAINYIATHHVDLIVLDVGLPVMDGFEFVQALGRIGATNIPIVVYTGRDLDSDQRSRLSLGFTKYLTKTRSSDEDLQRVIRDAIAHRSEPSSPTE